MINNYNMIGFIFVGNDVNIIFFFNIKNNICSIICSIFVIM